MPACPTPKVLDEVTQRCVYLEDCEWSRFLIPPSHFLYISRVALTNHAQSPQGPEKAASVLGLWKRPLEEAETSSGPLSPWYREKAEAQNGEGTGLGLGARNMVQANSDLRSVGSEIRL